MKISGTTHVQIENYLNKNSISYTPVKPSVSSTQNNKYFRRTAIFVPDRNTVIGLSRKIKPDRERVFRDRGLRLYYFASHTDGEEETVVKDHEV
ncbi:MAG: hypothetical protein JW716_03585 [Candidatus Aenigmarchaeota archaeon]|nr:hypothetical protein [Candidatus Aenigmarchaeota archaeon]